MRRNRTKETVHRRTYFTDVTLVNEDFADETLVIYDTQGDDIRGGDSVAGHGG